MADYNPEFPQAHLPDDEEPEDRLRREQAQEASGQLANSTRLQREQDQEAAGQTARGPDPRMHQTQYSYAPDRPMPGNGHVGLQPRPLIPLPFTQADNLRMQRLQQGLSAARGQVDDGTLTEEEGQQFSQDILKQLQPLQARQQQHQEQAKQQAKHDMMDQTATQEAIQGIHGKLRAQSFPQTVTSFTDPVTGETAHFKQDGKGGFEEIKFERAQAEKDRWADALVANDTAPGGDVKDMPQGGPGEPEPRPGSTPDNRIVDPNADKTAKWYDPATGTFHEGAGSDLPEDPAGMGGQGQGGAEAPDTRRINPLTGKPAGSVGNVMSLPLSEAPEVTKRRQQVQRQTMERMQAQRALMNAPPVERSQYMQAAKEIVGNPPNLRGFPPQVQAKMMQDYQHRLTIEAGRIASSDRKSGIAKETQASIAERQKIGIEATQAKQQIQINASQAAADQKAQRKGDLHTSVDAAIKHLRGMGVENPTREQIADHMKWLDDMHNKREGDGAGEAPVATKPTSTQKADEKKGDALEKERKQVMTHAINQQYHLIAKDYPVGAGGIPHEEIAAKAKERAEAVVRQTHPELFPTGFWKSMAPRGGSKETNWIDAMKKAGQ